MIEWLYLTHRWDLNRYYHIPLTLGLESHNQMKFSVIPRTLSLLAPLR